MHDYKSTCSEHCNANSKIGFPHNQNFITIINTPPSSRCGRYFCTCQWYRNLSGKWPSSENCFPFFGFFVFYTQFNTKTSKKCKKTFLPEGPFFLRPAIHVQIIVYILLVFMTDFCQVLGEYYFWNTIFLIIKKIILVYEIYFQIKIFFFFIHLIPDQIYADFPGSYGSSCQCSSCVSNWRSLAVHIRSYTNIPLHSEKISFSAIHFFIFSRKEQNHLKKPRKTRDTEKETKK